MLIFDLDFQMKYNFEYDQTIFKCPYFWTEWNVIGDMLVCDVLS